MKLELVSFHKYASPLLEYTRNVTSQNGEDGVIARIMELLQPEHRYCVEFGAWDGKYLSNCYDLLANQGWRGMMIEANAEKFKELTTTYATHPNVTCVNRYVSFEGPNRLDSILLEHGAPESFALLSIDIDGNDYHVWDSVQNFKPEVVCIEINPTVPNDVIFIQDKSFDVNLGCSLLALVMLGKTKGYELAACTSLNAFFVRKDKFPLLGVTNNFIGTLYRPMQNGRIFQGYDGSIHVVGMDTLIWRGGHRVSSADFQVISKENLGWHDAQKPEPSP